MWCSIMSFLLFFTKYSSSAGFLKLSSSVVVARRTALLSFALFKLVLVVAESLVRRLLVLVNLEELDVVFDFVLILDWFVASTSASTTRAASSAFFFSYFAFERVVTPESDIIQNFVLNLNVVANYKL